MPGVGAGAGGWNTVGEAEIIRGHISLTSGTLGTGHKETLNKIYSLTLPRVNIFHISPFSTKMLMIDELRGPGF